jgi:hypothetical protein
MGNSSQRHGREVQGVDSADQVSVTGTGGGYGGGGVAAATFPVYPPASSIGYPGDLSAVEFTGTILDQVGNDAVPFSLDTGQNFTGNDVPLVFTLTGGTLPTPLTLASATGIISGTPNAVITQAGIIITCTDNSSDTAVSNAFEIDIQA